MTIQVKMRTVYGNDLVYPVNEAAKTFALLVGKKTLSDTHLKLIYSLGFQIEWVDSYQMKGDGV